MLKPDASPDDLEITGFSEFVEIGAGSFGIVYRAKEASLNRDVAIKVLPRLTPELAGRFDRECQAVGALSGHPNVVPVYGTGVTQDGHPYLTMGYMGGGSLSDQLKSEGSMEWPVAIELAIKICGALETAHRAGVVHCDIKPANILRSIYGEPSLGDFGIARVSSATETKTSSVTATVEHAAPEVLSGHRSAAASDQYSLASTLFALIAGNGPFAGVGDSLAQAIGRVMTQPVPDLRAQGLPTPLADVIERALSKDPAQRYPSIEAFGGALQAVQEGASIAVTPMVIHGEAMAAPTGDDLDDEGVTQHRIRPVASAAETPAPTVKPSKRSRLLVAGAIATALALVVGALFFLKLKGNGSKAAGRQGALKSITLDLGLQQLRGTTLQVRRVWTLKGKNGTQFVSDVTIANGGDQPVATHNEVIPKELAASVTDIEFSPQFTEVIQADPVVRYQIDLAPSSAFNFSYQMSLPPDGVSEERLRRLDRARIVAQNAYDNVPADTPPEVLAPGGVLEVVGGGSDGLPGAGNTGGVNPTKGSESPSPTPSTAIPPVPPPSNPTGVTCTPAQRQITVSWNSVSGAHHYRLYEKGAVSPLLERTSTSATVGNLEPGAHSFQVSSVGPTGKESGREECSGTVPLPPAPPAPATLSSTPGQVQAVPLSWSSVPGAAKYRVYVPGWGFLTDDIFATSYTVRSDSMVPCGTYPYQVAAVDAYGQQGALSSALATKVGQRGGPSAHDASVTIRNGAQLTINAAYYTGVSDPDGGLDILNYLLTDVNFDGANFNFTWNGDGTFSIRGPNGFVGSRWLKFQVRDRCQVLSTVVTFTMNFFTQA